MRLVRNDPSGKTIAQQYDVEDYLKNGVASQNPECQPGDTIYVPRTLSTWNRALRNVSLILGIVRATWLAVPKDVSTRMNTDEHS